MRSRSRRSSSTSARSRSLSTAISATEQEATQDRPELHAAWASLAAYDSDASGKFLQQASARAKQQLSDAGFEMLTDYSITGGIATDFAGTREVVETDAAYLWHRPDDRRGILAFRGSDTQQDLAHVHETTVVDMFGRNMHAAIAEHEFLPLLGKMAASDFAPLSSLVVTGHSMGGGCASMFAVLGNDQSDPLGFGDGRKLIDELYAFAPTPVFHGAPHGGPAPRGSFRGSVFRAVRTVKGVEVQDRALLLAAQHGFHLPYADLVTLRKRRPPVVVPCHLVTPEMISSMPVDDKLFPLHNPLHYVDWLEGR